MSPFTEHGRVECPGPQTRETIREWDRRAIEEYGIPGIVLMENAGGAAARIVGQLALREPTRHPEPFNIVCGPGNNGGDGFVVARHLHCSGFQVAVWVPAGTEYPSGSDAGTNFRIATRLGLVETRDLPVPGKAMSGTIIDALFGTGLSRPLRSPYSDWIAAINSTSSLKRPVISLDIPSGLDANTGDVLTEAVRARYTITFAAPKLGFSRGQGPSCCGIVQVVDIGIPREIWCQ